VPTLPQESEAVRELSLYSPDVLGLSISGFNKQDVDESLSSSVRAASVWN
jgi:hypothetical protein